MAEQQEQNQQQPEGPLSRTENVFRGGMNKDLVNYLQNPQSWSHAKNIVIQTQSGDLGTISSESANLYCVTFPYTLIGAIPLDGAQYMVFCTDNTNSEIGIVDTTNCTYTT